MGQEIILKLKLLDDGSDRPINEAQLDVLKRSVLIATRLVDEMYDNINNIFNKPSLDEKQQAWKRNSLISKWLGSGELTEKNIAELNERIGLLKTKMHNKVELNVIQHQTCTRSQSCNKDLAAFSEPGSPIDICPRFFEEDEISFSTIIIQQELYRMGLSGLKKQIGSKDTEQLAKENPALARSNPENYKLLSADYYNKLTSQNPRIFNRKFITQLSTPRAALIDKKDKAYLFGGGYYIGLDYNDNFMDLNCPRLISDNWPGFPEAFQCDLDAALNGNGPFAGKAYFFKGDSYICYDWDKNSVLPGYPKSIQGNWPGFPKEFQTNLDAAINGNGVALGKAFFFKGDSYIRFDWNMDCVDPGYPKPIQGNWPGFPNEFCKSIAATLPGSGRREGKAYFFKGDSYIRFDWIKDCTDSGYPMDFLSNWDGKLYWIYE